MYDPDVLSPSVLPKSVRDEIHKSFEGVFDETIFNQLKNMFSGPDKPKKWEQAKEYTLNLDEIRKQNIVDYLPEFKDLFS